MVLGTRSTKRLPFKGDTMFDLLFLWGGIHGDVLTEVDVMINFSYFTAVDGGGFFYALSELALYNLGNFLVQAKTNLKASLVEFVQHFLALLQGVASSLAAVTRGSTILLLRSLMVFSLMFLSSSSSRAAYLFGIWLWIPRHKMVVLVRALACGGTNATFLFCWRNILIIIKVNYNYHKNYPRIFWGYFLKAL